MFNLYDGDYKRYLLVPAVLFAVFLLLIFVVPGVTPGIDLKGGTSIIVRSDSPLSASAVEGALAQKFFLAELVVGEVSSPSGYGLYIQFSNDSDLERASSLLERARGSLGSNPAGAKQLAAESVSFSSKFASRPDVSALSPEEAVSAAERAFESAEASFQLGLREAISGSLGLGDDARIQVREIGASLGENFYQTGLLVTLVGFMLVVVVVFLFFREVVPSAAIIAAIIFDIFGALALMAVFGIPLSLATIPALLMLIGYSVDTDIMLTTRILKRKDSGVRERAADSMQTGLTMTLTTLGALAVMSMISFFAQIEVVFQIAIVLLFGLFADIISTWLMNAPVLLWYAEKRGESE